MNHVVLVRNSYKKFETCLATGDEEWAMRTYSDCLRAYGAIGFIISTLADESDDSTCVMARDGELIYIEMKEE